MTGYPNYNPACPINAEHGKLVDLEPFNSLYCPHSDHSRGLAEPRDGLFTNDPEAPKIIARRAAKRAKRGSKKE